MTILNKNIKLLSKEPIKHAKASEQCVSVVFTYDTSEWKGYVPIEYRRTGLSINFSDTNALNEYLNNVYSEMEPQKYQEWLTEQNKFWNSKPKAVKSKEFFDKLAEGGWKCGNCEMPENPNPQRIIQTLKEFGYTIATSHKYCPNCKKKTYQRILLPITRGLAIGNGYETWSQALRKRIVTLLREYDVYEAAYTPHCLPDHKFPEIRWDDKTKSKNPDSMTDEEIKSKFQLLTNQRNQQKREVCRTCFQTGKRGTIYGINFYYKGNEEWDQNIPKKGEQAVEGCVGCPWYDIETWREALLDSLNTNHK